MLGPNLLAYPRRSHLSILTSRAIGQAAATLPTSSPQKVSIKTIYLTTGLAAALGILAGIAPKKEKTVKKLAFGGSLAALGLTGVLLLIEKNF